MKPRLCPHHQDAIAMNLRAISSHRRHKINAAIAKSIAGACPACTRLNKEPA